MSRLALRIVAAVVAIAIVAGGVYVLRQRREAERRQQQIADMKAALATMRDAIGSFRAANERYPASLEELVKYGLLSAIPADPVTGTRTWSLVTEERVDVSDDFAAEAHTGSTTSLIDVRSNAPGKDPSGKPWSSY